jgi:hypothetical protein
MMHDVYVAQLGNTTYAVRSNGRVIAKTPVGSDCARVLKAVAYKYYAIKCANNHGDGNNIGLRRVVFKKLV